MFFWNKPLLYLKNIMKKKHKKNVQTKTNHSALPGEKKKYIRFDKSPLAHDRPLQWNGFELAQNRHLWRHVMLGLLPLNRRQIPKLGRQQGCLWLSTQPSPSGQILHSSFVSHAFVSRLTAPFYLDDIYISLIYCLWWMRKRFLLTKPFTMEKSHKHNIEVLRVSL